MPKRPWTKEDVAIRLVKLANRIAKAHEMVLSDEFDEDRYRFLKEEADRHLWHWRQNIKGLRNERRRNNRRVEQTPT